MKAFSSQVLGRLEPLRNLSAPRLQELATLCHPETYRSGADPLRITSRQGQLIYLLEGELRVTLPDGSMSLMVGGCDQANWPLGYKAALPVSGKAITDVALVRIDSGLLDVMTTWDELTAEAVPAGAEVLSVAARPKAFSAHALTMGVLGQLPPALLPELLRHFEPIAMPAGQVVVREGDDGDFYFVIETGRCEVLRRVGGVDVLVAELKAGDCFGEEALVSSACRNATVRMKSDGVLLRLSKPDFVDLLKRPLLHGIDRASAEHRVAEGEALWLDVRYPVEFAEDGFPGAINVPLNEIRTALHLLDRQREYVVYCQNGRRSSAAAFLMAQRGFRAFWLEGGLAGGGEH